MLWQAGCLMSDFEAIDRNCKAAVRKASLVWWGRRGRFWLPENLATGLAFPGAFFV